MSGRDGSNPLSTVAVTTTRLAVTRNRAANGMGPILASESLGSGSYFGDFYELTAR